VGQSYRSPTTSGTGTGAGQSSGDTSTGSSPSVGAGQTHAPVDVDGAFNAPTTEFGAAVADDDRIKVLHNHGNPLRSDGTPPVPPAPEDLYERSSFFGNLWGMLGTDPAFHQVDSIVGTPAVPAVSYLYGIPNSLYIGGAPTIADIRQGDLADCYFLASVASVVATDPGRIQGAITGSATGATITLYRKDGANIVPAPITVTSDLRVEDLGEGVTGQSPLGAGVRAAPTPKYLEHYAELSSSDPTLRVYADKHYEMAMWAPLLEKAYGQYTRQYGQYGGFATETKARPGEAGAPATDYGYLEGGIAEHSYSILYGPDARQTEELNWTTATGVDTLGANVGIVKNLLWASGVETPAGTQMHMTVGANSEEMVERLDRMSTALVKRADIDADLKTDLTVLQGHIAGWRKAGAANKPARLTDVASSAAEVAVRTDHPELYDAASPKEYRDFSENLAIVAQIGDDQSSGDRHTYAWHSYTVLGSTFKKADGSVLAIAPSTADALISQVDPVQSTVRLRNPHGTDEPNLQAGDATNDGEFSMTLDSFARSFSFQQFGVVTT
jgi:hypothetical protein